MERRIWVGLSFGSIVLLALFFLYLMATEPDRTPVKIGVVLPLTGDFETYGNMGLQGAKMAVEEINTAGGVLNGMPLELVVEDNETDPNLAVRLIRKLIQEDDVVAVLGPVSSSARDAMTEVAREFKTPLLYGISYEGGSYSRYLFCYSAIPDHMIKPLVPFLMENYGTSFYVFGYDYVWPHQMTEAIKREVKKRKGNMVGIEFTPFGIKDFSPTLQRIRNSKAEILMLILPGRDGFEFIKQFNEFGLRQSVKMVAIAAEETYLGALPAAELEGIICSVHFLTSLKKNETRNFVERQKKMFGTDAAVTYSTESHYGLIRLLKEAIDKAGTIDKETIIDAMEGLEITVGNGKVAMREDHHMNLNMIIAEFTGGRLVMKKDIGLVVPGDQKRSE
ncbi:MAG: ABC transporter substrate-binding protein [Proteobacteria bacterium]|nr:ABC transporter substrate-binding protein [Pseudomonadota bacterium]